MAKSIQDIITERKRFLKKLNNYVNSERYYKGELGNYDIVSDAIDKYSNPSKLEQDVMKACLDYLYFQVYVDMFANIYILLNKWHFIDIYESIETEDLNDTIKCSWSDIFNGLKQMPRKYALILLEKAPLTIAGIEQLKKSFEENKVDVFSGIIDNSSDSVSYNLKVSYVIYYFYFLRYVYSLGKMNAPRKEVNQSYDAFFSYVMRQSAGLAYVQGLADSLCYELDLFDDYIDHSNIDFYAYLKTNIDNEKKEWIIKNIPDVNRERVQLIMMLMGFLYPFLSKAELDILEKDEFLNMCLYENPFLLSSQENVEQLTEKDFLLEGWRNNYKNIAPEDKKTFKPFKMFTKAEIESLTRGLVNKGYIDKSTKPERLAHVLSGCDYDGGEPVIWIKKIKIMHH